MSVLRVTESSTMRCAPITSSASSSDSMKDADGRCINSNLSSCDKNCALFTSRSLLLTHNSCSTVAAISALWHKWYMHWMLYTVS